ncbi:putative Zn finger-like uncharacterized protein [Pseudomonas hunanensis]|uniref:Zn finger-like uncharacterized protein n=1 Tax=Pseudomonas hunanensis TaxID=1247546 RepID=A0ACC6K0L0_9PSED|nr:DUF3426 domain-containing protein [Pseudomonas hunanensis]MDR6711985.1 putative Zn finger-like uncharacterized protein [Pseudomonas hunanensis]
MTDSFVTQCPHCQTSFRVTHHQLSVARGVVRCGQCLQVFNAAKQLLEQNRAATAQPAPALPVEAPTAVVPATPVVPVPPLQHEPLPLAEDDWASTSQALDELDLDQALADMERRGPVADRRSPPGESQAAPRNDSLQARRDDHGPDAHADQPFGNATDEPLAEPAALDEPQPPLVEAEPLALELAPGERTEPTLSLDLGPEEEPLRQQPSFDLDEIEPAVREQDRLAATDDEAPGEKGLSALDHEERRERLSARDDDDVDGTDHAPDTRIEPGLNARTTRRKEPLIDVVDDPLQLDWQKPKVNWGKRLLWGLLTLFAAGLLAFQYIWYHFDEMARQDQYRPWFQQLCPMFGCKVPTRVDIGRIKSSNLVVRSHPDFKGALIVDAIIYNRAPFAQPFPLLELRFADLNGQLIASRRFKPSEYLSGELAGRGEMPSQTPIHIALDILDPGAKAVNYSLSFRSPE